MKKNISKSPKPRYITIRIKYYPIQKKMIFSGVLVGMFFIGIFFQKQMLTQVDHFFKKETTPTVVPKFYSSPFLKGIFVEKNEQFILAPAKIKNDHVVNNGPRDKKQVALTFDADMTPQMKRALDIGVAKSSYNEKIVEILNQTKTKATIFTSGMWIEQYPEVMGELAANPLLEFGNHSYSHPGFDGDCWGLTPLPDAGNELELRKTQELLKRFTGVDNKSFRFPGGCYSQKDLESVWKEGMYVVHWDSVGNDGFNDDVSSIESNVLSSAQNGSVIVLHFNGAPNSPLTDDALPKIITTLKQRGFEFVKVSELLELEQRPPRVVFQGYVNSNIRL